MIYDFKNKLGNVATLNNYMLTKTLSMFEWENLPDTIPVRELEKMLQVKGYAFITKVNNDLYAFTGGLGGVPDVYGNPTTITISNPSLNYNATLDIKKDGVLIQNDDLMLGLIDLYTKHNTMLVENDINMLVWGYNSRSQRVISASDDRTKESAEAYLNKVIDGDLGIIGENAILEGVKIHGANSSQGVSITTMIEFNQYQKASLYNEVGLSANFNMKRERLISSEVEAGEDSLFPLVYNMMKCRLKAIEDLNALYNLELNIDFGSVWHFKNKKLVDDVVDPNKLPDETVPVEQGDKGSIPPSTDPEPNPEPDDNLDINKTEKTEVEKVLEVDKDTLSDVDKKALEDLEKELEDEIK